MPPKICINQEVPVPVFFAITPFVRRVLKALMIQSGTFEFTFVDNPSLVKLNHTYLNRTYETDIISFNLGTPQAIEGDVYISIDQATLNAAEWGHSLDFEVKTLLIHGILHLLEYHDYTEEEKQVMFAEQNRLLDLLA